MSRRYLVVLSLLVWIACVWLTAGAPIPRVQKDPGGPGRDQASHLRQGIACFEQGFYEFLPKNKRAEAEMSFVAAMRELELVLETEPDNGQAHRTIARIHSIRRNHLAAAEHYQRLTEIDPYDVDSYVLAALALTEAGKFAEAGIELEKAKGRTSDPRALALLGGYLEKLSEAGKRPDAGAGK